MMYIGIGDGDNVPSKSRSVQPGAESRQALGKIFRIDPLQQSRRQAYGIPADNPFVGQRGDLPEIWALGLRHPQNISFDKGRYAATSSSPTSAQSQDRGGQSRGVKGANYGWPMREGTFVTDRIDETTLYALPANDATKGFHLPGGAI